MGSKPRHSSRRKKAGTSVTRKSKPSSSNVVRRSPPDFDELLGRFSDALSILATATRALSNTQEDSEPSPDHDIGEDIATLEHGLSALRAVYDEFDVGIRELRE
jgi:hypothetical protein